jgi:hypothetical protein
MVGAIREKTEDQDDRTIATADVVVRDPDVLFGCHAYHDTSDRRATASRRLPQWSEKSPAALD